MGTDDVQSSVSNRRGIRTPLNTTKILGDESATISSGNVINKTVNQVDIASLKCTQTLEHSLFVALKSNGTESIVEQELRTKRQVHLNRISESCKKHRTDSEGHEYAGIEVMLDAGFQAYMGHFHPDVEAEIRADTVWRKHNKSEVKNVDILSAMNNRTS